MTICICGCNDSKEIQLLQEQIKSQQELIKKQSIEISNSHKKIINDLGELKESLSKLSAAKKQVKSKIEIQRELLIGMWRYEKGSLVEFFEDGTSIQSKERDNSSTFLCGSEKNFYSQWTILSDGRLKIKTKFKLLHKLNFDSLKLLRFSITKSELSLTFTKPDGSEHTNILHRIE